MSRLRLLRSLVFLAVFITPALSGHPQKQNADERTTPSLPARYPAAAPANMGQRVSLPGARFDPRQRLHAPGASTPQTTALADALAAASLVAGRVWTQAQFSWKRRSSARAALRLLRSQSPTSTATVSPTWLWPTTVWEAAIITRTAPWACCWATAMEPFSPLSATTPAGRVRIRLLSRM